MLPIAGVIVGSIGLLVGIYAAVVAGKVSGRLTNDYDPKLARIDDIASQASAAQTSANEANSKIDSVAKQTNDAFQQVGTTLGTIQTQIADMQKAQRESPMAGHGRHGGPVVAGPGEYIVRSGDSGARIARRNHVSLHDLMAVNPNVNWRRLHPGERIKLPEHGGGAPAPAPEAPAPSPDQAAAPSP